MMLMSEYLLNGQVVEAVIFSRVVLTASASLSVV
jgi:hypothetical protein